MLPAGTILKLAWQVAVASELAALLAAVGLALARHIRQAGPLRLPLADIARPFST